MVRKSLYSLEREKDVEGLREYIKESNDVNVRSRAAEILGSIGGEESIKTLIDAIFSDSQPKKVKRAAANSLAWMDDTDAVWMLIERMKGLNGESKGGQWGDLLKIFIKSLESDNTYVKMDAALALGRIEDKRAVKPLIGVLDDPDKDVRKNAAISLGAIGEEEAIQPLSKLLEDNEPEVRREAVNSLGQIGGEEVKPLLIKAVEDKNEAVREQAILGLSDYLGEEVMKTIVGGLSDEEDTVREAAAFSLMDFLSKIPEKRSHEIRRKISNRLENYDSNLDLKKILVAAEDGKRLSIRRNAIWLLGQVGDKEIVDKLISFIREDDPQIQRIATLSLINIGEESVNQLIDALSSEDKNVRKMAVYALGEIGSRKAIDRVKELMEDDSEEVRVFASKAYSKLGGE
ncbi:HEAT repeat domain-containing protein [Methanonatronarchaeum sp. AMET6-2]|uniref:HEAT repeat domain-containing protein n=1 Tax=Methanonatronarchaeum sp. AMET6-2 TaxID=2933293 RepID=UPI0012130096|nr:HEAT repeat domain-containing protein [Methanonatronarchaeum sp. AMET6-2]RZN62915.1 MAG: HEAT repeat domain-containing protein [Methanonatronarchaeia archaeon]UOY09847.1 HEAT repeat domain-containing protein [Methanonatronarchaeum sp. AMET6-2]